MRLRHAFHEEPARLRHFRHLSNLRRLPAIAPAVDLPGDEATGTTEVGKTNCFRIDLVQVGEGRHQLPGETAS